MSDLGDLGDLSLLDLFRTEVESQAAILNEGLLVLEADPSAVSGIDGLMRAAHSLKGAARMVQLDAAVEVSHAMEDYFVAVQEGGVALQSGHVDVLFAGVDMLEKIVAVEETGLPQWLAEQAGEIERLVARIRALAAGEELPAEAAADEAETPAADEGWGDLGDLSLLDLFRTEVESQAAVLNEGLLVLEADPSAVSGIDGLMRAAHSLKGAARMVQLDAAVEVSHAMEDYFVAVQEGGVALQSGHVDVLFAGVDMLEKIVAVEETGLPQWLAEQAAAIEGLTQNIRGLVRGEAPAPVVAPAETPQFPAADLGGEPAEATVEAPAPVAAPAETPQTAPSAGPEKEPPAAAVAAADAADGAASAAPSERQDRVVRITSDNLERLMGLAGEALVETRWLQPFADALLQLKYAQAEVGGLVEKVREEWEAGFDETARERLVEVQQKIGECRDFLNLRLDEMETFARRSENLSNRLYHEAIASRMRPFADGVQGFPRMVRDIARTLGKKVRFEVLGRNTEVDRDILEKLEAPLNHLLRNSLDHGIESPDERRAAGKGEEGHLVLEARHAAGMLSIAVRDDGRGMDLERLRGKIVDRGHASAEMAAQMGEAELMEFLFLPGFSTAEAVTEISGRGVGLDVVHSMVQEVGGLLQADSRPGQGMEFHLQLPLTLSVMRALVVEVADEPYAFPLARIDRTLRVPRAELEILEGRQYCRLEDHNVGLVHARQVLELEAGEAAADEVCIVVLSDRLNRYGLVVDRFRGEGDLVVRPLDPRLGKTRDISAAALLEDGAPVLILDVEDMVRSIDNLITGGRLRGIGGRQAREQRRPGKRILVVDDSITVREVERKLLENHGYEVEVAVDGMDGWNAVRSSAYDLVISDVDMPRMTGIELVQLIKGDGQLRSLPVMIVSYKDREEDRLRGLEAGANYYLTKSSFHDASLLEAVVDLIGEA